MQLTTPRQTLDLSSPRIMGVLNVTPDSFSDGGQHDSLDAAVEYALDMARQGAAIIDIGGESSRPGATRIDPEQQIARVQSVIAKLREALDQGGFEDVWISIDTTHARVAEAAIEAGASLINDISAGREDPAILELAADRRVPICLMHMQNQPATMQQNPTYIDVVAEVEAFLLERRDAAVAAGIAESQIILDPGIGFGKTLDHNLALLRALPRFAELGQPVLLGVSRKRMLAHLAGHVEATVEPAPYGGTAAVTALAVQAGVHMIRVHDVALNHQAAATAAALH
jgi:dihydropteroate synthase